MIKELYILTLENREKADPLPVVKREIETMTYRRYLASQRGMATNRLSFPAHRVYGRWTREVRR